MPRLKNIRHEAFAQSVAAKSNFGTAYAQQYPKASGKTAYEGGSRLAKKVNVRARIQELTELISKESDKQDKEAAKQATKKLAAKLLTMSDRRGLMALITNDAKAEYETRMRAAMNDAKLAGELIDKSDLTSDGEALPSMMPTIELRMPQSFVNRRTGRN